MATAPRTAFVLAGGGSLGAVEVGMLRVLAAHGLRADLVVGVSVGAINAAYYAANPTPAGVAELTRIWSGLRTRDVFPFSPVRGFLGFVGWQDALVDPTPLRMLLARELPYGRLDESKLPCHIVATDVLDGQEIVLSKGDAVTALLASAAIPGVFPPVAYGGKTLIDGGVANNTPIATAISLGTERVIVLPTGYSCAGRRAAPRRDPDGAPRPHVDDRPPARDRHRAALVTRRDRRRPTPLSGRVDAVRLRSGGRAHRPRRGVDEDVARYQRARAPRRARRAAGTRTRRGPVSPLVGV
jgi:predicted acylesterase/phospholipase RssA